MKFLLTLLAFTVSAQVNYSGHSVYRFNVRTDSEVSEIEQFVNQHHLDTWSTVKKGYVDIRIPPNDQKSIPDGLEYEKTISDLQTLIHKEFSDMRSLTNGEFADSYHSLNEINTWMKSLNSSGIFTAGKTYEGRDIQGIKFGSSGKKVILAHGGIHAREWIATASVVYMINAFSRGTDPVLNELLKTFEFQFIPVVNGDGYEFTRSDDRMWRKNRQPNAGSRCVGTDPNRNWGFEWRSNSDYCSEAYPGTSAFSTPETKAVADHIKKAGVLGYLDLHAYGQMFMGPYGYSCSKVPKDAAAQDTVAKSATKAITATSGRRYKQGSICNVIYQAFGSSVDWAYSLANVKYPYGVELPDTGKYGFVLPASFIPSVGAELLAGLKAMAQTIKTTEKL